MLSRRKLVIALLSTPLSAGLAAAPLRITWNSWLPEVSEQTAAAKDGKGGGGGNGGGGNGGGGKGGGGGNGNSGGNGGGNGSGGGNRGGGNGNGNGGHGSNGKGNGNDGGAGGQRARAESSRAGKSKSAEDGSTSTASRTNTTQVNPETGDKVEIDATGIAVTHDNGMSEAVRNGRYLMKDSKGRTIIERGATTADVTRLRGMI